ncbi:hypothetical protein SAMN04489752_0455 [Brevibacterium siliguriense]|uniref:Uncharacterized protein n=1 Tax=Brevibacterium siliguriense TaxID=1136497 RepID=A0A1H1MIQ2_9MICO|nr:hypothetical protein [Brevibacterium siliguriense]SDR86492.1 hypothetical protein SAMN04489752_0455 [Brevibacterium siliguriense]
MRVPSRRTASILAAAVLILPMTLGAGSVTAAQSSPLCSLVGTCDDDDSTKSEDRAPADDVSPGMPVKPSDPPTSDPTVPAPDPTDEPSGEPTDEPSEEPTDPGGLGLDEPSDDPTEDEDSEEEGTVEFPSDAQMDENAPVFTKTPAAMGSDGLSFKGLKSISFVSVPTADGGSIVVLKIRADEIKITGFSLTVRPPEEHEGLVTKADTMTLSGDVTTYIGSITATTKDGKSLTIGPETPPPMDDVEPGLLRVTMGLVGSTADSITYTNTDQKLKEVED